MTLPEERVMAVKVPKRVMPAGKVIVPFTPEMLPVRVAKTVFVIIAIATKFPVVTAVFKMACPPQAPKTDSNNLQSCMPLDDS